MESLTTWEERYWVSKNWFIENTFVTKEGLNIEYLENTLNEDFLTIKTFTIKPNHETSEYIISISYYPFFL